MGYSIIAPKQEVDLVVVFELFLIGKHWTELSSWYIFNEYSNWSEINLSNCTIHGRTLALFLDAVYISQSKDSHRKHSEGLRLILGGYSDMFKNGTFTMQRFPAVSRCLYSGGWQVCQSWPRYYISRISTNYVHTYCTYSFLSNGRRE